MNTTKSKPRIAKPSPRQPKGGRVMWVDPLGQLFENREIKLSTGRMFTLPEVRPVLVLDLSDEARERRVERITRLITIIDSPYQVARAVLAAIGDVPVKQEGGK